MATQKKATKKTVKTAAKTVAKVATPKTVAAPVQSTEKKDWKEILTRVVLVFETAVLYFIILFILFVANNFTVMFFPKG